MPASPPTPPPPPPPTPPPPCSPPHGEAPARKNSPPPPLTYPPHAAVGPPLPAPFPSPPPHARHPMLRQQWERPGQKDFRSLADYIAPQDSGRTDYLGAFAVTTGIGCDELAAKFEHELHDDYLSIMTKALADRLAEA